jgi:putative AlgH/UPF0301 family transcriptional regulator
MTNETKAPVSRFLPGNFLVATPYLQNVPYQHSVVLVMRHDEQGALGFVMDNQLQSSLRALESFFRGARTGVRESVGEFPGLRMFTGVVLWPAGKLEEEIDQGIWMRTPARLEAAMVCENLWADLVRKIGRDVLHDGLGIREFPADPSLN